MTIDDYKAALAAVKREIKAFEAESKAYGGSYRDATGNYSEARYREHNRLYERKQGLERGLKLSQAQARRERRASAR